MAGYIRQSTFVDGDTITAALFNNEYNQLVNAFSNTSGHKHDGTTAEGPVIGLIGDAGETSPNNKVLIDTTNNYIEFYVEVSSAPVQQLYIADGAIIPVTDSDIDLGTTSLRFKDTYTDTVTTTGNVSIGGDLTVTGSATISGNLTFGDADTDSINLAAEIDSDIIPNTDGTYDLGSATKEWQDLYIDGTANIDSLVADTADINGGTIDGATIATSDITVGAGKTLNVSAGTLTLADNQISGDKVEGGTIAATTITTLTSTTGNITNVNATTVDSTNLEVTNLKAKDGTAAGSIADSTGVVTLASSVLTTTDINGGTIDGVTIGGSSAGAVTFTDLSDGTITIAGFADEDNMVSDSATLLPTQQSVKAYVDAQVTAQDLDFQGDTGGALSIDLDSESLTIAGGTGLDTVGSGNTVTVNIDSTVATLTGTQTLTNKTLTSPDVNTPDIDGGTIDGTVIGGATPAAGTFTTLTANTSLTGTLATAAQTNITSVGTLTGLDVAGTPTFDGLTVDGNILAGTSTVPTGLGASNTKLILSNDSDSPEVVVYRNTNLIGDGDKVGAYLFGNDDNNATEDHFAGIWAKSSGTGGHMDIYFAGGRDNYENDTSQMILTYEGNVGIGTTSPSQALDVVGAIKVSDGILNAGAGGSASVFNEDGTTADFRVESTGNTHMLFVDGGLNRVGIGTSSPESILHIEGSGVDSLRFGNIGPSSNSALRISRDDTSIASGNPLGYLEFGGKDTTSNADTAHAYIAGVASGTHAAGDNPTDLTFGTTPSGSSTISERMRIDASGNVGIGQSTINTFYDKALGIYGASNSVIQFQTSNTGTASGDGFAVGVLNGAATDAYLWNRESSNLLFGTAGSEKMRIDSSGNVGIGATTIDDKLHLEGSVNAGLGIKVQNNNAGDSSYAGLNLAGQGNNFTIKNWGDSVAGKTNQTEFVSTAGSSYFVFTNNGSESMRIDSSGRLLHQTTSSSTYPTGSVYSMFGVGGDVTLKLGGYGGSHTMIQFLFAGNNAVGSIVSTASATSYNTSSDARLKDITGSARGLEVINELNPVSYNWKADGKADEGLIAQEVMDIVPNAVSGSEEEMYQMDYSKLVVHLVKAVKEQQTQIEALQSEINLLKGE